MKATRELERLLVSFLCGSRRGAEASRQRSRRGRGRGIAWTRRELVASLIISSKHVDDGRRGIPWRVATYFPSVTWFFLRPGRVASLWGIFLGMYEAFHVEYHGWKGMEGGDGVKDVWMHSIWVIPNRLLSSLSWGCGGHS